MGYAAGIAVVVAVGIYLGFRLYRRAEREGVGAIEAVKSYFKRAR